MRLALALTACLAAALSATGQSRDRQAPAAAPSALEQARDRQDRAALQKIVADETAAAARAPNDAGQQYRAAVACSYLAEVLIEQHESKPARRQAAEQGIKAGEKAVSLKRDSADYYRILGTLYGQAITDVLGGFSYGAKAKDALNRAMELAPKSSQVWVAHGVGTSYLPTQLGGGPAKAVPDFRKAIELDPKNAEAYLWLGVSLRKNNQDAEARQALSKALELNPNRVWVKQQLEKTPAK